MLALKLRDSNFKANNSVSTPVDWRILVSVKKILLEKLGCREVEDSSKLQDDLGMDSLDGIELIMTFENKFGFDIPDEDADALGNNTTPMDISRYIMKRLKNKNATSKEQARTKSTR